MSHDTLLHRLVRPAARGLARTPVTPNQLTTLRLATGLAAAAFFARGGANWPLVGAVCMIASLLLDRADGELARATGRTSQGGYRYDLMADGISTMVMFVGMGVGSRSVWGPASAVFGAIAAVSVFTLFLLMPHVERLGAPAGRRPFDPDDALLLGPPLILAGLMPWTLLAAVVFSPLVVAGLTVLLLVSRPAGHHARTAAATSRTRVADRRRWATWLGLRVRPQS